MIKFFRTIRQSLLVNGPPDQSIREGQTIKYIKYAIGEIVLVVIGILIALSINNWNEARKNKLDEIKVLSNIKKALISDLDSQFSTRIETISSYITKTNSVMKYMNNQLPCNDSLALDFSVLSTGGTLNWTPQLTAIKLLESKGIDLIKNDSLLEAILNTYNLDYPSIQSSFDNYKQNIHEYGRPIARRKFNIIDKNLALVPLNYNLLLNDVEFINTIKVLNINSGNMVERILNAKVNVEHVITMINDELADKN